MYSTRGERGGNGLFFLMWAILFSIMWACWGGWRIYNAYHYDIQCGGHLKRAADANTIELAQEELSISLTYLENTYTPKQLQEGNTGVFMSRPSNDVGFWYKNLKASSHELSIVRSNAEQLEKSNVLMKLRETLLDAGKNGQTVTHPDGISVYPYNVSQFWFAWAVGLVAAINWLIFGLSRD